MEALLTETPTKYGYHRLIPFTLTNSCLTAVKRASVLVGHFKARLMS